ncbi:MAG: hypothetical protein SFX73_21000 [Kofleriaceae bacterium]|nr:hypothetical protein [Kofleriaceae bacterium]
MSRISILVCLVAFACGGSSKPAPVAPLPADKPAEPVAQNPAPPPTPEPTKKEEPPPPMGPISVKFEPQDVKVKVVSTGKGAKSKLAYAPKAGTKQPGELAIDFYIKQSAPAELGGDDEKALPTMALIGDSEAKTADKDGAEVVFTVTSTDARPFPGRDQVPLDKLKELLATAKGLTLSGKIAPTGAGDTTLSIEKATPGTVEVMQMLVLAQPTWPVLPDAAVGVGAKWKATTTTKLMSQVAVTVTTDYELVAKKGTTWTIKGKTKVTGVEQDLKGAKVTGIQGTGETEATLVEGAVLPTFKTKLDAGFSIAQGDKAVTFAMKIGTGYTANEAK